MALVDVKKTDAILAVARGVVPRSVETDRDYEDWNVIAPALVSIAADLFEGIIASVPPRGRIRAEVLARSLAEYAITFAWLAGPEEGRGDRIRRLLKDEFREREKTENKLGDQIIPNDEYKPLIAKGLMPKSVVPQETKEFMAELLDDETIKRLPNALEQALDADREWMPRVETIERYPFVLVHFLTFSGSSSTTHPSITGIGRVVTEQGSKVVVGMPQELGQASGPYGGGYLALVNTLWVAARTLGWPAPAAIQKAMERT